MFGIRVRALHADVHDVRLALCELQIEACELRIIHWQEDQARLVREGVTQLGVGGKDPKEPCCESQVALGEGRINDKLRSVSSEHVAMSVAVEVVDPNYSGESVGLT